MLGRDGMVKGSDGETCCRLLLLEANPGSLDEARLTWPSAEVFKRSLSETQGVADQISREKIQIVFSDLSGAGCSALNVLSQIRRVHPQLPLVAILPDEDFSLGLSAFRLGADDVLVHPLDKDALLACRDNLQSREQEEAQFARTQQEAKRSLDDLILLKAIGETTSSTEDLQKLLDRVVDLIQGALDVEIVSLMLVDEENVLTIRSACGLPDDIRHKVTIAPGEGVSGHVLLHGEAVLIDDLSTDGRFPPRDGVVRYRTGSLLSVPIQYQQRIVGVLNVNNKRNSEAFTGIDQELLQTIAHQAALAIENMKLVGHLQGKMPNLSKPMRAS
jgi:DNA-binding NarL/FixJ family response regulator